LRLICCDLKEVYKPREDKKCQLLCQGGDDPRPIIKCWNWFQLRYAAAASKEGAKKVIKALEATISDAIDYRWATTKEEILNAMRREFVTRDVFEERINALRVELLGKTEKDKSELLGKIEALYEKTEKDKAELEGKIAKIDQKLNFMIILMFIALTLMNPVVAEILKRLLKL